MLTSGAVDIRVLDGELFTEPEISELAKAITVVDIPDGSIPGVNENITAMYADFADPEKAAIAGEALGRIVYWYEGPAEGERLREEQAGLMAQVV